MAFFLLGRIGDTLNLLCPDTFATRQDALAALSRVTAEPGFDLWDAEVLLVDTDSGTPVLLVRPNPVAPVVVAQPAPAEELEIVVVDELDEVPEESEVAEEEPAAQDEVAEEPVAEESADADNAIVDEDAGAHEVTLPAVEDAAIADAIVEEYEEAAEQDAASALKDALTRTAAQMEAEGIVAPESIGSAESESEAPAESEPDAEVLSEAETEPAADSAWPWDVAEAPASEPAVSPEIAFVLSELEEPSLDDGSILRGAIDDETFAVARPVIMGSYADASDAGTVADDEVVVEPMGIAAAEVVAAPSTGFAIPVVGDAMDIFEIEPVQAEATVSIGDAGSIGEAEPSVEVAARDLSVEEMDSRDISDFILDLGALPDDVSVASAAAAPVAPDEVVIEYTCDDCIYEDTCPNRDQRLPKDCGSFQWR